MRKDFHNCFQWACGGFAVGCVYTFAILLLLG